MVDDHYGDLEHLELKSISSEKTVALASCLLFMTRFPRNVELISTRNWGLTKLKGNLLKHKSCGFPRSVREENTNFKREIGVILVIFSQLESDPIFIHVHQFS